MCVSGMGFLRSAITVLYTSMYLVAVTVHFSQKYELYNISEFHCIFDLDNIQYTL